MMMAEPVASLERSGSHSVVEVILLTVLRIAPLLLHSERNRRPAAPPQPILSYPGPTAPCTLALRAPSLPPSLPPPPPPTPAADLTVSSSAEGVPPLPTERASEPPEAAEQAIKWG